MEAIIKCVVRLEAKNSRGNVETIEVSRLERSVVGLTTEEVDLTPAEEKPARRPRAPGLPNADGGIHHICSYVYMDCMKFWRLCDQRTREIQTLLGTIIVDAQQVSVCPCRTVWGVANVSWSPLAERCRTSARPDLGDLRRS